YADRIVRDGLESMNIPLRVAQEADDCNKKLTPHGWTITKATEYVLAHVIAYQNKPPVKELIDLLVADTNSNDRRPRSVQDLRSRLKPFSDRFGSRQLHTIQLEELRSWNQEMVKRGLSPLSRRHYLSKAGRLYSWAKQNKY